MSTSLLRGVICVAFVFLHAQGSLEVGLSVDYVPLDGDALYEFLWAGSSAAARAEDVALLESLEADDADQLLPNELLDSGYTDEVVAMATAQQEKYKCVLPKLHTNEEDEFSKAAEIHDDCSSQTVYTFINLITSTLQFAKDGLLDSKYLTPESLLQPLLYQCLKLNQGYWEYELCHGQSLRQYHQENTGKGMKMDEYVLGRIEKPWKPDLVEVGGVSEEGGEGESDGEDQKIPTWHFNGYDYPYHKVEMTGGSPCDLRGNNPRSVSILYICQHDVETYGMLLLVEESSACHYVAIVGTKQLCQNRNYRQKEQPVYTISCYSELGSPKKPGILREHELEVINSVRTTKPAPKGDLGGTIDSSKSAKSEKSGDSSPPAPTLDENIVMTFLTGEMCLRGGSGWWIHELCLQNQVKQIHMESDVSETQVVLGVWNEDNHKVWYLKEGHKRRSQTSVSHIYQDGDVCDITGKPRVCYVKFKCVKSKSPSQISLYLTEQSVCVYVLTVEGRFICNLLSELDEHGMFQIKETMNLFGQPQADSSSEEAVSQSQSSSISGQSQVEESSELGQSESLTGSESEHSQTPSGSTLGHSQTHSGSKSGHSHDQTHSSSKSGHSHDQTHSGSKSGQKTAQKDKIHREHHN